MFKSNARKVVDIISQANLADVQILAVEAAKVFFPKDQTALLYAEDNWYLLAKDEKSANNTVADICELMSRLKYMETNHIVCVLQQDRITTNVFQEGVSDLTSDGAVDEYGLGNGNRIRIAGQHSCIKSENGTTTLPIVTNISNISSDLNHYFHARIIPTALMPTYKRWLGLTLNDFVTRASLIIAALSLLAAIGATWFSPRYSVEYANDHGYSTIKQSQFDSLMAWPMFCDSMVVIKRDTVYVIVHDTVYEKVPSIDKTPVKK